ncbi:chromate transporter [Lysobacter oculi]|uniref:Chromate transporter n=1 Tax=Solilutibacter oculi TaxID=2698682 RepID=A0A344J898_9GAMM|nr:chromate efflux transporter [Lysobacter oculi]AXA85258.1 chromate transporter [Lysobacter oculi]
MNAQVPIEPSREGAIPNLSLFGVFLRFLRFGAMAWGGPVAQIGMIRQELVDQEGWIDRDKFNRVLAVYQVLPGPEAHELCVYFGTLARGRLGGIMAGLGFMLPGFLLMLLLSWLYVRHDLRLEGWSSVFVAVQAAVAALIVRAIVRIGGHVLEDRWLWMIALVAMLAQLANVHFAIILVVGGVIYLCAHERRHATAGGLLGLAFVLVAVKIWNDAGLSGLSALANRDDDGTALATGSVGVLALFWSGLKAGLLTFGGAYTVIPFLQRDAVTQGAWMSNGQFLDGLALSGLLPAPLVIFATFVGYIGGGPWGAVAMTAGVFLPAFSFTLLGHDAMERWVHRPRVSEFLAGVTAAVVGLIAGTTLALMIGGIKNANGVLVFSVVLALLFWSKSRWLVPAVILGAGLYGWLQGLIAG